MCLSIPGKVIYIDETGSIARMGKVDFGGVIKDVSLAYVPEARPGDYVIVHVGFAISIVDPDEAEKTFEYIAQMQGLEELTP